MAMFWPYFSGLQVLIVQALCICTLDAENKICVHVYSALLSKTSLVDTLKNNKKAKYNEK